MKNQNRHWGFFLFLCALFTVGGAYGFYRQFPPESYKNLYHTILPWCGILFSLAAIFMGHFSYPRVFNLKIYLIGYFIGVWGCAYFALGQTISWRDIQLLVPYDYALALKCLAFLNILILLFIPSTVKYRTAKKITVFILAAEVTAIALFRFVPSYTVYLDSLLSKVNPSVSTMLVCLWFCLVVGLSAWRVRAEFYLGGIISGYALFYLCSWLMHDFLATSSQMDMILFTTAPLFVEIGIVVHWFSRMEHRIAYDPLLHIYNRSYCSRIIDEQVPFSVGPPLAVAMVDIDHFKSVNDIYGHQTGDLILYNIAQAIQREVVPKGIACRYGGEEIVIFFPRTTAKDIMPVMENVRKVIFRMATSARKKKVKVTISCGISHRETISQSIMEVINAADKALYRAKKGGRNAVRSNKTPLNERRKHVRI